jgi:hypothetical protein
MADKDVLRLYVSMNKVFTVHPLKSVNQLQGDHKHSFQAKVALAKIKELHQVWSHHVHHKCKILPFYSTPVKLRESN